MANVMPQEIEVWYIIPSLRREIAKHLVAERGFPQKKVAGLLGVTESAVSQYLKDKRAKGVDFNPETKKLIYDAADRIGDNKASALEEICRLCEAVKASKWMCSVHRKYDENLPGNCDVCGRRK
ncbi:Uncharacterised protein [uncultured archaeon]|nr:Uncharacterised protein [uncultured archaeon]